MPPVNVPMTVPSKVTSEPLTPISPDPVPWLLIARRSFAVPFAVGDATAALPLADVIDTAAEAVRLEGKVAKLDAEIAKLDKKLENQQFLAKAPEDVIEELRERRAGLSEKRDRLKAALERLSAG